MLTERDAEYCYIRKKCINIHYIKSKISTVIHQEITERREPMNVTGQIRGLSQIITFSESELVKVTNL